MFNRNKIVTITIPKLGFRRQGETDWGNFFGVIFSLLGFIVVATISLALVFHLGRAIVRKPGPPPKVIYKTITITELSAAQKAFISDCQQNTQAVSDSENMNNGIPNVSVQPWTCVYAGGN